MFAPTNLRHCAPADQSTVAWQLFHFSPSRPWNNYLNLVPSRLAQSQGLSTSLYAPSASGFHHSSDEASHSAFSTSSAGSSTDPASRDGHYGSSNSTHTPPVSSLSFAPPSGRSYLLLAAGARDGRARVWRITPPPLSLPRSSGSVQNGNAGPGGGSGADNDGEDGLSEAEGDWTARLEVELESAVGGDSHPHPAAVAGHHLGAGNVNINSSSRRGTGLGGAMSAVKVEWNILGTVLSTSGGEDGRVRVWKREPPSLSLSLAQYALGAAALVEALRSAGARGRSRSPLSEKTRH